MVLENSDRTIHGITAKELLFIHPADMDYLQRHEFELAAPIGIQISAKAARALILEIYGLSNGATIGFSRKNTHVWFRDDHSGEFDISPLSHRVVFLARQFAAAIKAQVTNMVYLRSSDQDPRILISLAPA